jgi:hypothetical protein
MHIRIKLIFFCLIISIGVKAQSEIFAFKSSVCGTFYANETTANGTNYFERYSCLTGSINTVLGKEKIFKIYLETLVILHISDTDSQLPFKINKFFYKIELFNLEGLLFNKIVAGINA